MTKRIVKHFQMDEKRYNRVYKYNEELLLTEVRYDDGSVQKYTYDETLTETVRRTEMATRRTGI